MSKKITSRAEQTRYYPGFSGVDFTSDPADVEATRMAFCQNVWRDWQSEQGGAIETVPGYREVEQNKSLLFGTAANGIHTWRDEQGKHKILAHIGTSFRIFDHDERDGTITDLRFGSVQPNNHRSVSFIHHNSAYVLDGRNYIKVDDNTLRKVADSAYVPTSYADGEPYEQRNMLTKKFKNRYNLVNLSDYIDKSRGAYSFEYDTEANTAAVTGFSAEVTLDEQRIVILPESTYHDGQAYAVTSVAENAFANNAIIERVYISRSIERIEGGAFYNCSALKYVDTGFETAMTGESELPQGALSYIGGSAFSSCASLYMVTLLSNVELIIDNKAFSNGDGDHGAYTLNVNSKYFIIGPTVKGASCGVPSSDTELSNIYWNLPFISTEKSISVNLFFTGDAPTDNTNTFYYLTQAINNKVQIGDVAATGNIYTNTPIYAYEYNGSFDVGTIQVGTGWSVLAEIGGGIYDGQVSGNVTLPGPCTIVLQKDVLAAFVCTYNLDRPQGLMEYGFTVYDPCATVEDITLNGASIMNNGNYEISTVQNSEGYIGRVMVAVSDPTSTLEGGVLEIHGEGVEGKFTAIKDYVNAMDGNVDYSGTTLDAISKCTIATVFDDRVFLSGNPELPNTVFYSQRDLTGFNNPAYIGILNFFNDGVSNAPIVAMMATAGMLCVLKGDTTQEPSIYYHTGTSTGDDIVPRIYPSVQGLAGLGCLGAACNFYDDPVFISRRGLEAIGKEQVNLERSLEHRSYNVDVKLTAEDLKTARIAEWLGYLVILVGGYMYLADSRQIFTHKTGVANYEWYRIGPVGFWENDTVRYQTVNEDIVVTTDSSGNTYHASEVYTVVNGEEHYFYIPEKQTYIDDGSYYIASSIRYKGDGFISILEVPVKYVIDEQGRYVLVDTVGERAGGTFVPATEMVCVDDALYLLAGSAILIFNTDKRGVNVTVNGEEVEVDSDAIHKSWYTFCGHRYESGFATKLDNCDVPHMTKQTRRNSYVLRTKSLAGSKIKARGRSDRGQYTEWVELATTAGEFDLSAMAFDNFSTVGRGTQMCIVREGFRRWVEKQIYFYSDDYQAPIGIHSAVFRYSVQGRVRV